MQASQHPDQAQAPDTDLSRAQLPPVSVWYRGNLFGKVHFEVRLREGDPVVCITRDKAGKTLGQSDGKPLEFSLRADAGLRERRFDRLDPEDDHSLKITHNGTEIDIQVETKTFMRALALVPDNRGYNRYTIKAEETDGFLEVRIRSGIIKHELSFRIPKELGAEEAGSGMEQRSGTR